MDFSPTGWGRVLLWTLLGTLGCIAVAVFVDSFNFPNLTPAGLTRALLIDILVPTGLAAPMLALLLIKMRKLAIAHDMLLRHASTDTLTRVLNRAAFTQAVEELLADAALAENGPRGAMLVVDADNFKAINDTYGHDHGDDALRTIARAIRSVLRAGDPLGRIGGEEFAVFLAGTPPVIAEAIAERLRLAVENSDFAPGGKPHRLSVSVGGAVFERPIGFNELFSLADQQLYAAKRQGRNRVMVSTVSGTDATPAAA